MTSAIWRGGKMEHRQMNEARQKARGSCPFSLITIRNLDTVSPLRMTHLVLQESRRTTSRTHERRTGHANDEANKNQFCTIRNEPLYYGEGSRTRSGVPTPRATGNLRECVLESKGYGLRYRIYIYRRCYRPMRPNDFTPGG